MNKNILNNIPFIGSKLLNFYEKLSGGTPFTSSAKFWEDRYQAGGNSGSGSYNALAEYKAEILNEFVAQHDINSVIEFGCGDGNQVKYFRFKSYKGYDVSPTIIQHCKSLFKTDSSKHFDTTDNYNEEQADLVLSLDVIYHLVEEDVYMSYMQSIFSASKGYVIVYSSNADEHENNGVVDHVKHRKFTNWVQVSAPQFKLIEHVPNKFSYDGDGARTSYADFYIFKK